MIPCTANIWVNDTFNSIKDYLGEKSMADLRVEYNFQFHQGLSLQNSYDNNVFDYLSFNSIKDYLTSIKKAYNNAIITFNSIKDYQLSSKVWSIFPWFCFQFHQGLSFDDCGVDDEVVWAFNSIKDYPLVTPTKCISSIQTFNSIKDYQQLMKIL